MTHEKITIKSKHWQGDEEAGIGHSSTHSKTNAAIKITNNTNLVDDVFSTIENFFKHC